MVTKGAGAAVSLVLGLTQHILHGGGLPLSHASIACLPAAAGELSTAFMPSRWDLACCSFELLVQVGVCFFCIVLYQGIDMLCIVHHCDSHCHHGHHMFNMCKPVTVFLTAVS
ncbi:hypothetical protein COO60DRAFT_1581256, partial [Scenedesmus sp. NREL 46B-D3]